HEGSFDIACKMIEAAAINGADAVKFQTFKTEHYVSNENPARFAKLKSFELSYDDFSKLAKAADDHGIMFLSTPFDLQSAEFLDDLVPAYKIASGDNTFYPLIERVARTGKPILLSTGMTDTNLVQMAVSRIRTIWQQNSVEQDIGILHCVSSYPTPADQANLQAIVTLQHNFDATIGYSDHTLGCEAAVISAAIGARIIEKHFTLDKNFSDFRDHQLSATPAELKQLVLRVREVETLLGDGIKKAQPSEIASGDAMRRSIAVSRDVSTGECLRWEDLTWIRPGNGFKPGDEAKVLGRVVKLPLTAGRILQPEHFE
ncbi:N-acetylneuraminate synthase family protein, partial [bacterium]|nr:N-acetylneuraminate synthase family protein [bacterium]